MDADTIALLDRIMDAECKSYWKANDALNHWHLGSFRSYLHHSQRWDKLRRMRRAILVATMPDSDLAELLTRAL